MLNCEQAARLASEGLDRPLTLKERLALRFHTLMCRGCRRYRRHLEILRRISRAYVKEDERQA
ncbi:hypothetical protein MIT9_P1508 [Methylomarinovum caldicuralii]|uniref:Putative zinc-finger domain-containing protein n=1 Tax=Methylomarinovum caldicuralii TaxID=438856 RepID=A0AAU9BTI5_9GAMM|nr:zf-HC2 domain-containing protein [Methylomarinovum caldicuralii]BCX81926.1 hypothetical protein MIT9_P1508 [Methylomarinovum caldicuralii]